MIRPKYLHTIGRIKYAGISIAPDMAKLMYGFPPSAEEFKESP